MTYLRRRKLTLVAIATILYLIPSSDGAALKQQQLQQFNEVQRATADALVSLIADELVQRQSLESQRSKDNMNAANEMEPANAMVMIDRDGDGGREQNLDSDMVDKQDQQRLKQSAKKYKLTLKKRWHKIVDDLIDGDYPVENGNEKETIRFKKHDRQSQQHSTRKAKRFLNVAENEDEGIKIFMKNPSIYDENKDLKSAPDSGDNSLGSGELDSPKLMPTKSSAPVNPAEHRRKVLNDGFGIRDMSVFVVSNELGAGKPQKSSEPL